MTALFEYSLPAEEPLGLVGPWQASATPAISFAAGEAPSPPNVPLWRANLPADEHLARQALAAAQAHLSRSEAALEGVPASLEELISSAATAPGVLSFGLAAGETENAPQATLLNLLDQARALEQGRAVSFGVGEIASAAWEQARAQFEAFVQQIQREVLNLAWVETRVADVLQARTILGWSGDAETVWQAEAEAAPLDLHVQSLRLAVRSRLLRFRLFVTVTGGAARLSLLLASPAGAWLALPAAWKYVNEILNQIQTYQTLTQGG